MGSQYGPVWQSCPTIPPDEPVGPSFSGGLQGLYNGIGFLNASCGKCCKDCNCQSEARAITAALMQAWIDFYGQGPMHNVGGETDQCGGFFCYDWNSIYMYYLNILPKSKCFSFEAFAAMKKPIEKDWQPVHFFIRIKAGDGGPGCESYVDDGYGTGTTTHMSVPLMVPGEWVHHIPPKEVFPILPRSPIKPATYPRKKLPPHKVRS